MTEAKRKILFIINPISGVGKKNIIPGQIEQHLDHTSCDYQLTYTEYRQHGHEIALQNRDKFDVIVAVGGDGSVNEIGSALIASDCALGILPCGSGNGLARHLKIPLKLPQAIRHLNSQSVRLIDTGTLNNHVFLGTCGFGFDAYIAKKFDEYHKRGFFSYARLVLREFKAYKAPLFTITANGKTFQKTAFMCSIANSSQFGNGFVISPESIIDDGKFELIFLSDFKLVQMAGLSRRFFTGTIHHSSRFEMIHFSSELLISIQSEQSIFAHLDGEPLEEGTEFAVSIKRSSLKVI